MGERRTLRVVAEVGDGWNTFLMPEEEYRHKLDILAGHCKDVGRDPGDIRKQLGVSVILGESEAEAEDRVRERAASTGIGEDQLRGRFLATTPERCAEVLRPFRDLGVGDFLMLARPPADDRTMELWAGQVAPALRAVAGRGTSRVGPYRLWAGTLTSVSGRRYHARSTHPAASVAGREAACGRPLPFRLTKPAAA